MKLARIAVLCMVILGLLPVNAWSWDYSVPEDADMLVRTYYNSKNGPFDQFTLPKNDTFSRNIESEGVYIFNIFCYDSKFEINLEYLKWSKDENSWISIPFDSKGSVNLKIDSKTVSWAITKKPEINRIYFANPKLLIKKLPLGKKLSLNVKNESKSLTASFNLIGLKNYMADFRDSGCK